MEIIVNYYASSIFEIHEDLSSVNDWYVKWDVLYVQHHKGDPYVEYEPCASANDDHELTKYPESVYQNNVQIK